MSPTPQLADVVEKGNKLLGLTVVVQLQSLFIQITRTAEEGEGEGWG